MNPEAKIKRANEAQALLTNEAYREAWSSLESDLIQMWAGTTPTDQVNRERYYHQLTGLRAVKTRLERWISEGRKAADDIERTKRRGRNSTTV